MAINDRQQGNNPVDPVSGSSMTPPTNHKAVYSVLITVIVLLIGAVAYLAMGRKSEQPNNQQTNNTQTLSPTPNPTPNPTPTPIPNPTSTNPTADWKTYSNTQYGFEFKYPSNNETEITQDGGRIRIQNYNPNTDALRLKQNEYYLYVNVVPSDASCLSEISNSKVITSTSNYKVYTGTASEQGGDTGGTVYVLCAVKTGQYPYYSMSVTENSSGTIANNIFSTFKFTK